MALIESDAREKVKSLLKELFQFDVQDLDFGIYRIMNFKRNEIEKFIDHDLIAAAEKEFEEYSKTDLSGLQREVDRLKAEIERDFGEGTIDGDGEVRKNKEAPKVREYLQKKDESRAVGITQEQKHEVFNHVYEFFSRYYDKGDFLSKRRFGGKEKYYVPYDGEEVLLYWANQDQYYIKSGEYFKNYSFRVGAWRITFALEEAEIDMNNVKGEARYFLLSGNKGIKLDEDKREAFLHFDWRAITDDEKRKYGARNTQEAITSGIVAKFLTDIGDNDLAKELRRKVKEETTLLEKHIAKYVRRNTTDYFIHRNLESFLEQELDFYLKNEVLDIDEIEHMDERNIRITKAKIRAIKIISNKVIDFLAQIEDFQRKMFEKKKFVLGTDYCITLGRVPTEFYSEIGKNERQVEEWKNHFEMDEMTKGTFYGTEGKTTLDAESIKLYPYLVLDTAFFDHEFKDRLLGSFNDLEEKLDGLLVKSENFQALNLLSRKYEGQVKCVYIDPPYNTGNDEFLYKDNYQHSSWLAMMTDRLRLAHGLLQPSGTIGVSIDNNELDELLKIMDLIFRNRRAIITVKRGSVTGPKVINPGVVNVSENLVIYSKSDTDWQPNRVYRERERDTRYNSYIINRDKDASQWVFTSLLQAFADFQGIPRNRMKKALGKDFRKQLDQFVLDHADAVVRTAALDDEKISKDARELKKRSKEDPKTIYHLRRQNFEDWYVVRGERILFYSDRVVRIGSKVVQGELVTDIWDDTLPNDLHNEGGVTLKKGKKPEKLIGRLIELATNPGDLVLDFFAGTGTACAAAQKMGRKWIGVDVADFFDSLLVRRLKNTLDGEQSGISSANNWKGGGFFKYQTLEQYEDTLNNIVFRSLDKTFQETLDSFHDYFLRYMLEYETRESPTRLVMSRFKTPFSYKIKTVSGDHCEEVTVDLVETFNYLLGLNVEKLQTLDDEGRTYLVIFGKHGHEKTIIIWRDASDLDLEKDRNFIQEKVLADSNYDRIFVNGDSYVKNAQAIEPQFKKMMGV